jgi:hypothetical protein
MLLSRRLIEAGVPIVTVVCAANDLTIPGYDYWDTHGENFNRLKNIMSPTFDRAAGALLDDLVDRGLLDGTLVVFFTEFGRPPVRWRAAAVVIEKFSPSKGVALRGMKLRDIRF